MLYYSSFLVDELQSFIALGNRQQPKVSIRSLLSGVSIAITGIPELIAFSTAGTNRIESDEPIIIPSISSVSIKFATRIIWSSTNSVV
ncbi:MULTISPECIES: hypothetical protein [Okeania]|uniref:hypothetical protein n=1 Tax=Okeania TaxID=1458928 RepID=UPI001374D06D|nr:MULTISPECIES: hypothetical protein [Okeania]NET11916.1 hypothetical protein [Okeania sp. SIO1H6]NES76882.1 hypothetical protein [Okeania sp. SIO1H4]NET20511.1 hypothetical protein [Okeania sp. SIO1H5]NET78709.1 hypothetical protein [Okeania sp. SIO1F9]NET93678.1 hypothetical protein [Okeania sp. SIO1H2]